jgi:AraC-like DNA-binding protein
MICEDVCPTLGLSTQADDFGALLPEENQQRRVRTPNGRVSREVRFSQCRTGEFPIEKLWPANAPDERIVTALKQWLGAKPNATVGEMAASIQLSPARFSHLFARTTGMLPRSFLQMLKRYHAERTHAVAILREVGRPDEFMF